MPWIQTYAPIGGSIGCSAAVASIPLAVVFVALAVLRIRAHTAAMLALGAAVLVSVTLWGMPARLALLACVHGAAFGLFPVFYVVLATLFLYNVTVAGGQFEIIRSSIAGLTPDRRLQALLIAFCFGAFIEGAAGFGTPVAIAGATLAGLGFRPFYAAAICLVANTAPVAFGSIGIPIVTLGGEGVLNLNSEGLLKLSTMVGHQLPLISLILPLYLMLIMAGLRRSLEILPAIGVCGGTFALCQWATASFLGPYLPDIIASLASIGALVLLLRVWKPKRIFRFSHDLETDPAVTLHTRSQVVRAWLPYLALTGMVLLWGLPPVKRALNRATVVIPVQGLDQAIVRGPTPAGTGAAPRSAAAPKAIPASFRLDYLATSGTAVVVAALLSSLVCGLGAGRTTRIFAGTLRDMRNPAVTIASILALAYVMNASGMTQCLGLLATRAGRLFPLLSPVLGWVGVFLTGSDTSSNALFGGLQKTAAEHLGLNPILMAAANSSGGVMGKMISPQSIAVACAATGMVGDEGALFRVVLRHSLVLLSLVCILVFLQAYYLTWMVP